MKNIIEKWRSFRLSRKRRNAPIKKRRSIRKKHFDMERLLRGEFFKFFKGVTFKVSVGILLLSLILTLFLYGNNNTIMSLINRASEYLGGGIEADVFTAMDEMIDSDILSLAGEFGIDIPTDAIDILEQYLGEGADEAKVGFLSTKPSEYYYNINPARYIEDYLSQRYSEELTEFILTDRTFLRLLFNDEALYNAAQELMSGGSSALIDDALKLIDDNKYFADIIASALSLFSALQTSPVVGSINEKFDDVIEAPHGGYTAEAFYIEFFTAIFTYGGSVTETGIASIVEECYKQTRAYYQYNVAFSVFAAKTAVSPFDMIFLYREIYRSGIIGALFATSDRMLVDFAVNLALIGTGGRDYFSEADKRNIERLLPAGYADMSADDRRAEWNAAVLRYKNQNIEAILLENADIYQGFSDEEAKASAESEYRYRMARQYVFDYLELNYPDGFYKYAKTLPLFDGRSLKRIVPDPKLQTEISKKQSMILDTYVKMLSGFTDTAEATNFVMYFVAIGSLHDMLYTTYSSNMESHREALFRFKRILDFFNGEGEGKTALDFINAEIMAVGRAFKDLSDTVYSATEEDLSPEHNEEFLEAISERLDVFAYRYMTLNEYMRSGGNIVTFAYYKSTSAMIEPDTYAEYDRQYRYFAGQYSNLLGSLQNMAYSVNYKIGKIQKFVKDNLNYSDGFFSEIQNQDKTMKERMEIFLGIVSGCYTTVIDRDFFDEHYAFLYDEIITAFTSYFTVYKDELALDEEYMEMAGVSFDEETLALFAACYEKDNGSLSYEEFRSESRRFTRVAMLIEDYVPKVYLTELLRSQDISDSELGKVYGMISLMGIGVTKYSMKSSIQKDLFYLNDLDLYGKLTAPATLDNGFAFMNFGFTFMYLFVMMIAIVIASGTIAGEYETGSIKLLLIRPYKRHKVLTAKYLFVAIVLFAMFAFMYGTLLLFGEIGGPGWAEGWPGLVSREVLVIFNAEHTVRKSAFTVITLEFLFYYIHCLMYAIIAVAISTMAKSRVASVVVSVAVFFLSSILTAILSSYSWYKYIIFNNTDLFIYLSTGPSLGDMTLTFSVIVYVVYLALIMGASYYIFEKRDAV